jgi:hypothetical protein
MEFRPKKEKWKKGKIENPLSWVGSLARPAPPPTAWSPERPSFPPSPARPAPRVPHARRARRRLRRRRLWWGPLSCPPKPPPSLSSTSRASSPSLVQLAPLPHLAHGYRSAAVHRRPSKVNPSPPPLLLSRLVHGVGRPSRGTVCGRPTRGPGTASALLVVRARPPRPPPSPASAARGHGVAWRGARGPLPPAGVARNLGPGADARHARPRLGPSLRARPLPPRAAARPPGHGTRPRHPAPARRSPGPYPCQARCVRGHGARPLRALPLRSAGVRPLPQCARSWPWCPARHVRCPGVARHARTAWPWHPTRCARSRPDSVVAPLLLTQRARPRCGSFAVRQ